MNLAVATARRGAYLRRVSLTRLVRLLAILALVLSPLAMVGGAPASAAAHHAAMAAEGHQTAGHQMAGHDRMVGASEAAASHCTGGDGDSEGQPCPSSDCLNACAAVPAIPASGGQLDPCAFARLRHLPALVSAPPGLVPEAATPPPRALLNL